MAFPLISEYIEAIKSAEDNFEELSYLRPVLGDDGLLVMTSGNFAVVFKMEDVQNGKFYAVKCFTKEQEGRAEAYREIAKELKDILSPYLVSIRYLENELFVDTNQTTKTEFPVLLMDWVEGKTLDKYLRENLDDKYALEMLAYRFSQLAHWLIPQPFAHGDLKPDNILVREDGSLVLVDYVGMYVPAMKGQRARELGSPDFRHPQRIEDDFDEHIDDFPLVSILLSLNAINLKPSLIEEYGASDRLLFSERDYQNSTESSVFIALNSLRNNAEIDFLLGVFSHVLDNKSLSQYSFCLIKKLKTDRVIEKKESVRKCSHELKTNRVIRDKKELFWNNSFELKEIISIIAIIASVLIAIYFIVPAVVYLLGAFFLCWAIVCCILFGFLLFIQACYRWITNGVFNFGREEITFWSGCLLGCVVMLSVCLLALKIKGI